MNPGRARLGLVWLFLTGAACADRPSIAHLPPPAPVERIDVTVLLVGDAGVPDATFEPVLAALTRDASAQPARTVVAFLGDNIYPRGMPAPDDPERPEAERRLNAQLAVLHQSGARGIFVPGNHDWAARTVASRPARHEADGWDAVRRQEAFIAARGDDKAVFLPQGGCPGPSVLDLSETLRLVVLDTQWWLHDGPKPDGAGSGCAATSSGAVTDSLRGALRDAGGRVVAVLAHHPLRSGGPHGGQFGWTDHLFPLRRLSGKLWIPLPGLGSSYPLARKAGISSQDMSSSEYGVMRDSLRSAFSAHPPLLYAAGHDHSLQVLRGDVVPYHVVTGAGAFGHVSPVEYIAETRYAHSASGYVRMDVLQNGRARLSVIEVDRAGTARERYSLWLD